MLGTVLLAAGAIIAVVRPILLVSAASGRSGPRGLPPGAAQHGAGPDAPRGNSSCAQKALRYPRIADRRNSVARYRDGLRRRPLGGRTRRGNPRGALFRGIRQYFSYPFWNLERSPAVRGHLNQPS